MMFSRWIVGFLCCLTLTLGPSLQADVRSLNGVILFDVNSDTQGEATLNSTGLGIGIAPSSNLHVSGNAIISGALTLGGTTGASNLNINGSFGLSVQTVSSNTVLGAHSMVLVDTSSDNVLLTLPYAANVSGRVYHIKKTSVLNKVWLSGGGNTIDGASPYELSSSSNLSDIKVMSDGFSWYVISSRDAHSTPASSNLIAWWRMDETSGTTAYDSSNNGLHGTLVGGLTFSNNRIGGMFNSAINCDRSNDVVNVPDHDLLSFGNGGTDLPFSLSFWVNISSGNSNYFSLCGKYDATPTEYYLLLSNSDLYFRLHTDTATNYLGSKVLAPFSNNVWYHVVATYSGNLSYSGLKTYINGSAVNTNSAGSGNYVGMSNDSASFQINGRDSNNFTGGSFDDFRIYNKALTAREVLSLYQSR